MMLGVMILVLHLTPIVLQFNTHLEWSSIDTKCVTFNTRAFAVQTNKQKKTKEYKTKENRTDKQETNKQNKTPHPHTHLTHTHSTPLPHTHPPHPHTNLKQKIFSGKND